nr:ComEC/Rec2 family competence protein [Marinigracilibium pacificum]
MLVRTGVVSPVKYQFYLLPVFLFLFWILRYINLPLKPKISSISILGLALLLTIGIVVGEASKVEDVSYGSDECVFEVLSIPEVKNGRISVGARLINHEKEPQVLLNVEGDDAERLLLPGNILQVKTSVFMPERINLQGVFDYQGYLKNEGIQGVTYTSVDKLILRATKNDLITRVKRCVYFVRCDIREILIQSINDYDSRSILEALILGDRSGIDNELSDQYARLGLLHVLAVSGMHVGFVFILLSGLLKLYLKYIKKGVFPLLVFGILVLCSYAIISGGAPSVCRAAFMFSLIWIGSCLKKKYSVLNAVFASAFFLCLFDPSNIFRLSFQLSYAAVIGIILLYPVLRRIYRFSYKGLNIIADIVNVSLAAQIATFPLMIYHFGYWSPLSLLVNIPMAVLIPFYLYSGWVIVFLSFLFNSIPFLPGLLERIIFWQHQIMDTIFSSRFVFNFPRPDSLAILIFGIGIIFLINLLASGNKRAFRIVAISMFSFLIIQTLTKQYFNAEQKIKLVRLNDELFVLDSKMNIATHVSGSSMEVSDFERSLLNSVNRSSGGCGDIEIYKGKTNHKSTLLVSRNKNELYKYYLINEELDSGMLKDICKVNPDAVILSEDHLQDSMLITAIEEKRINILTLARFQSLTLTR